MGLRYAPAYSDNRAAANRRWVCARRQSRCLPWRLKSPNHPGWSGAAVSFCLALLMEGLPGGELRGISELLFDAQKLVVFRDAVRAAGGAGLDLPGARGHHQIGDECIFSLA